MSLHQLLHESMMETDLWADADMESVVMYLRGNRRLNVPNDIRTVLNMSK